MEDFISQAPNFSCGMHKKMESKNFKPPLDILDNENECYVNVEIAGVKKENISITLNNNIITISGTKLNNLSSIVGENNVEKPINVAFSDRSFGEFSREIKIPKEVDIDSVEAKVEDGILHVIIHKTAKPGPVKIDIN